MVAKVTGVAGSTEHPLLFKVTLGDLKPVSHLESHSLLFWNLSRDCVVKPLATALTS